MKFQYRHRVRYRECDPMGVVYHGHFLDFFEYARTEALRELGVRYRDIEEAGTIMPVVQASVKYLRPARYDDELNIETDFGNDAPVSRVDISYQVRRTQDNELLATGSVTLCFVDSKRGRPVRAPQAITDAFTRTEFDG